jgi:hypothetical protein
VSKEKEMRKVLVVLGLVVAFAAGGAGGYAARTVGSPSAAGSYSSACPAGSHAAVWYTARTWACLPNS